MKDFVLSLLSRGCGQVVQTEEENQGGRLEVYFEPEDYFSWRSRQTLLPLTRSRQFWTKDEPSPPKTYSTRRGPLVLYSQDLALSSWQPDDVSTKTRGPRRSRQEVELQVCTPQELTGAIVAYGKKQPLRWCGSEDNHPPLPVPPQPKLSPPTYTTQLGLAHSSWQPKTVSSDPALAPGPSTSRTEKAVFPNAFKPRRTHVGLLPLLPKGRATHSGRRGSHWGSSENQGMSHTGDLENSTEQSNQKTYTMSIMVEAPRLLMTPIPEADPDAQEDPVEARMTHRVIGCPGHIGAGGKHAAAGASAASEPCPLRTACVDDSWDCSPISRVTYYGGHLRGAQARGVLRHKRPDPGDRGEETTSHPDLTSTHLPPLPVGLLVGRNLARDGAVPPEGDVTHETQIADVHSHPETRVRKLLLPLLVTPRGDQVNGQELQGGVCDNRVADKKVDKSSREFGQDTVCTKTGAPVAEKIAPILHSNSFDPGCLGMPEPEDVNEAPSLGVLPPLVGCKGPGKQSSMALHRHGSRDLQNPREPHHVERNVVRGSLPAELREWENGGATGTLIMGPNGEVIRLSVWPPTDYVNSHQLLSNVIQEQALRVLASEVALDAPWSIVLQSNAGMEGPMEPTVPTSNPVHLGQQTNNGRNPGGQLGTEESQGARLSHGKATEGTKTIAAAATTTNLLAATSSTMTTLAGPAVKVNPGKHEPQPPPLSREVQKPMKRGTRSPRPGPGNRSWVASPQQEMHHNSAPAPVQPSSHKHSTGHLQTNENPRSTTEFLSAWQGRTSHQWTTSLDASDTEALDTYRDNVEADETQRRGRKRDKRKKGGGSKGRSVERLGSGSVERHKQDSLMGHRSRSAERFRSGAVERGKRGSVLRQWAGSVEKHRRSSVEKLRSSSVQRNSSSAERPNRSSVEGRKRGFVKERGSGSILRHRSGSVHKQRSHSVQRQGGGSVQKQKRGSAERHRSGSVEKWKQEIKKEKPHKDPASQGPDETKRLKRRKAKGEKVQKSGTTVSKKKTKKVKGQAEFVVGKPRERMMDGMPESRKDDTEKVKVSSTSKVTVEDKQLDSEDRGDSRLTGDHMDHEDAARDEEEDWELSYMSHSSVGRTSSSGKGTERPFQPGDGIPHQERVLLHRQVNLPVPAIATKAQMPDVNAEAGSNTDSQNKKALLCKEQQAAELAERAERRRREVERKRQEREEERKRQQEREEREERMRLELEMEQQRRAEELRLRKLKEQEERQRQAEQELERMKREQAEKEAERRRQEEKRRQMQHLMRLRQEEQERRAAELERQRLEQEAREAEEKKRLQEMEERERSEYLRRQQEAEEEKQRAAAERRRIEEEEMHRAVEAARLQAEIFARQRFILEQKLQFQRGLQAEADALGLTQDISRPWVYSYFSLLNMLGLPASPTRPEDLAKDSRE